MAAAGPYTSTQLDGRQVDGYIRSKSVAGSLLSVTELKRRAKYEVDSKGLSQNASLDRLFREASESNRFVTSHHEFGRRDLAYVEWIKVEFYILMVKQNPNFPFMGDQRKYHFNEIEKLHLSQGAMIKGVEDSIRQSHSQASRDDAVSSARSGSRGAMYSLNSSEPNSQVLSGRYTIYEPSTSSQQMNGATGLYPTSSRPATSTQDDPLMERFRKMRFVNEATQPAMPSTIPESLRPARPATPSGASNGSKPSGPRPMPVDKELPATPPRLNTEALLNSLPRAPSPIYTPVKAAQNPNATPPRQKMAYPNPNRERKPFPHLPNDFISSEELYDLLKSFKLLLIDVRPREQFDAGHIHARNTICVEPISFRHYGMSLTELKDAVMIHSPDEEIVLLDRLTEYDLVVYYDGGTSNSRFVSGPPPQDASLPMRYLWDTLTEYNDGEPLLRDPKFLKGGIRAWADLVSTQALQTSATRPAKTIPRKPHRKSLVTGNSVRNVLIDRLNQQAPFTPDEIKQFDEQAAKESSKLPELSDYQTIGRDSVASQAAKETFVPIASVNELLRQGFDPSRQRQSMTSPAQTHNAFPPSTQRQTPRPPRSYTSGNAVPPIPSRPRPTASRPSYSGVSDHPALSHAPSHPGSGGAAPAVYQPTTRHWELHKTGLYNFGATCYMNSVLQCLMATFRLTQFFSSGMWETQVVKNWKGSNGLLPTFYNNVLRALVKPEKANSTVRPSSLRGFCARLNPMWGSNSQQDAHEFLVFLLDVLHEDLNQQWQARPLKQLTLDEERYRESQAQHLVSKKEWQRSRHMRRSEIDDIFLGQKANRITCPDCGATSTKYDEWTGLQLPFPRRRARAYRIEELLEDFCANAGEPVPGYECAVCKHKNDCAQRARFTRLPNILVLSVNRFTNESGDGRTDPRAIKTPVAFPLTRLDMQPFMADTAPRAGDPLDPANTPPFTYDCYAVIRHSGASLHSGHYVAVCKDPARGKWREFNDEKTRSFDPVDEARTMFDPAQAYILFYERSAPR